MFPSRETPLAALPTVAGIRLGHFEIEERIARGGMGTVFRACDLRLDRVVALKVLSQEQLRDPAAIARFENEARAAAKLDHENIARVYFIGEDRGVHFIAFEYVRGDERCARPLPPRVGSPRTRPSTSRCKRRKPCGTPNSPASSTATSSPRIMIVTPSGRVKLVDIGLARQVSPTEEHDLTVTGTTLGTFDYISPEQARDPRNVDIRSDIYSLGCTLYQMLTGSAPYPNGGSVDKLLQHSAGRPPDPCELNPQIAPRLCAVVQRMMASNPDERYATPQALIDELVELAADLGLRATAPEGTIWRQPLYQTEPSWWQQNRGWVLAFGTILLLALVGNDLFQWVHSWNLRRDIAGTNRTIAALSPAADRSWLRVGSDPATRPEAGDASAATESNAARSTGSIHSAAGRGRHHDGASAAARRDRSVIRSGCAASECPLGAGCDRQAADRDFRRRSPGGVGAFALNAARASATTAKLTPRGGNAASEPPAPSGSPLPRPATSEVTPGNTAAAPTTPFVVLGSDGTSVGRFQSLEAACHVARTGAVIEIHHHGPLPMPQKPVVIQGKRLTIRPATGLRPQLTFIPGEASLNPKQVRMIEVIDGSLELYDVDLRMTVDNSTFADEWVLLSLTCAREAVVQRVTMTVANSGWRRQPCSPAPCRPTPRRPPCRPSNRCEKPTSRCGTRCSGGTPTSSLIAHSIPPPSV